MVPKEVAVPFPPAVDVADWAAQFAVNSVAPVGAPEVPPEPIVTTFAVAGVVEIVEVPETVVPESVVVPVTNTSPAPPPPPRLPNPPPPPPPTTATSIAEIPVGVAQTQLPVPVSL